MEATLDLDLTRFNAALSATLAESKREAEVVLKEQARGVIRTMIDLTPPGSKGVRGIAARQQGEAAVEVGIRGIYGTPSQAYDALRRDAAPGIAEGFWRHLKRGDFDEASQLSRSYLDGRGLYEFDRGRLHQDLKRGRARPGNRRKPIYYTYQPAEVDAYIKDIQKRVGWLAAGWNMAAAKFGIEPPAWIWRHSAPGKADLVITDTSLKAVMTNGVKYASQVEDLVRRLDWALDYQAGAMERRTANMLESVLKRVIG